MCYICSCVLVCVGSYFRCKCLMPYAREVETDENNRVFDLALSNPPGI